MTAHVDTSTQAPTPDRAVAAALAGSAASSAVVPPDEAGPGTDAALAEAARAWRWVVGTEALDLYAIPEASPHWQATCIAAGGALHRARVALAAEGLQAHITLLPEPAERTPGAADRTRAGVPGRGRNGASERWGGAGDRRSPAADRRGGPTDRRGTPETSHLARLVVTGMIEITDEAVALYAATDPTDALHRSEPNSATHVAGAASHVAGAAAGPAGLRRLRSQPSSRGVARELVKAARAEGVRLRLIRDGDEYIGVMHGPDTGEAWLRAGMACSAVRLLARRLGLLTMTAIADDDHAPPVPASPARPDRRSKSGRRLIGDREGWLNVGIGTPYLRLRLTPLLD
jgi:hypothetical protein